MDIEREQINSRRDGNAPWYGVDVQDGDIVITEDEDGGRESKLSSARTGLPDHVDLPEAASSSNSGDVRYAVTEEGELLSYDPGTDAGIPSLRAHIGFYDSESNTLTLADFVGE